MIDETTEEMTPTVRTANFYSLMKSLARWCWVAWPVTYVVIMIAFMVDNPKLAENLLTIAYMASVFASIKVIVFAKRTGELLNEYFETSGFSNILSVGAGINGLMYVLFLISPEIMFKSHGVLHSVVTTIAFACLAGAGFSGRQWFPKMKSLGIWSLVTMSISVTCCLAFADNSYPPLGFYVGYFFIIASASFGAMFMLSLAANDAEALDSGTATEALFEEAPEEPYAEDPNAMVESPGEGVAGPSSDGSADRLTDYLRIRARLLDLDNPSLQSLIADPAADERTRSMASTVLRKRVAWESINLLPDWQLMTLVHNEATDNYTRDAASLELYNRNSQDLFNELRAMSPEQLFEIRANPEVNLDGYYEGAGVVLNEMGYRTDNLDQTSLYSC